MPESTSVTPPRVPFSFELYPARTPEGTPAVERAATALGASEPSFISVTFGAAGSTTDRSLSLVQHVQERTAATPLAHLTCIGASIDETRERTHAFLDLGVRRFLALRGDERIPGEGCEVGGAVGLIPLLREVHAERGGTDPLTVAVAAFPNGHPLSRDRHRDVRVLLEKQEAGADFALTQLFFDADDYLRFVDDARAAGVTIPIIPGIMPITTLPRVARVRALTGEDEPGQLVRALEAAGDDVTARREAGVSFAAGLVRRVVDAGAPGVHLYAFNRHETVLETLDAAGLRDPSSAEQVAATNAAPRDHATAANPTPSPAAFPAATILGYPRIGRRRELKRAVERHWAGAVTEGELEQQTRELRRATRRRLADLGLGRRDSSIPESFSYYDQVLDAAVTVGAIPQRFAELRATDGSLPLSALFTLARGDAQRPALELTKWFDTNYHHLVPEIEPDQEFALSSDRFAAQVAEAVADGFVTRPTIVGPVTLLALSKPAEGAPADFRPLDLLDRLLPVYVTLLADLRAAGADWVQLDEPALVSETLDISPAEIAAAAARALAVLGRATDRPQLLVATPYGTATADAWPVLAAAPVEALALDLVRGASPSPSPGLADKTIVGGVVDGRNIWRGDLGAALTGLQHLRGLGAAQVAAGTSTSLQHVPHDVTEESELDARLASWIAFADQKVQQIAWLGRGLTEGRAAIAGHIAAADAALRDRAVAEGVVDAAVRERTAAITDADRTRSDAEVREAAQEAALGLPLLPTTTIGSFPQTGDIRRTRAAHDRGELSTAEYERLLRLEITSVIGLQEELGLDVLVHGEPERNDMVQYFAENLDGFAVTRNGWVQSYGSRATRPSILWGDVSRPRPITVRWAEFAQSLTDRPVKGMLTGPVTILAWSFVRDDQPLSTTADQVALALRDEVADLEAAGIGIIQVDEPALRELLPLRTAPREAYLAWSVGAFRLATAGAADATQVHTHLCYSEFATVIEAIAALDADVTSIEAARSRAEVVADISDSGFARGVGPGVYDIHSPRVPSVAEVTEVLDRCVGALPLRQLWVNPDCGLKTRGYAETSAALSNLVEATRRVREREVEVVAI